MIVQNFQEEIARMASEEDSFGMGYMQDDKSVLIVIHKQGVNDKTKNEIIFHALGISLTQIGEIIALPKEELVALGKLARIHAMKREIAKLEDEITIKV